MVTRKGTKKAPAGTGAKAPAAQRPAKYGTPDQVRKRQWADVDFWRTQLAKVDSTRAAERRKQEQLPAVSDRQLLEDPFEDPDNPALDALRHQWQAAVTAQEQLKSPVRWVQALREMPEWEAKGLRPGYVIDAILQFVDLGMYPPPEYLLALVDTFGRYYEGNGSIGLEETLFGPPVRKAGNHATRSKRLAEEAGLITYVAMIAGRNHLPLEEAAVKVFEDLLEGADLEIVEQAANAFLRRNRGRIRKVDRGK